MVGVTLLASFQCFVGHATEVCCEEARELENGELRSEARLFLVLFPKNLTGNLTWRQSERPIFMCNKWRLYWSILCCCSYDICVSFRSDDRSGSKCAWA